ELQRVSPSGVKSIVINLIRVEVEVEFADRPQPALKVRNAGNIDQANGASGSESERGVRRRRIDGVQSHGRERDDATETEAHGIDESGREGARLFQVRQLSARERGRVLVVEGIGRGAFAIIEHVGPEEAILVRELVVNAGREVVLARDLLANERIDSDVAI